MIKMTQKNYEAIKIYNQKEKIFELKGQIQTLKQQLKIAVEALSWYDGLEDILIGWELVTWQKKGTAKQALKQIKEVR